MQCVPLFRISEYFEKWEFEFSRFYIHGVSSIRWNLHLRYNGFVMTCHLQGSLGLQTAHVCKIELKLQHKKQNNNS